jgi:adenine-specific DNA-methyltransferase
LLQTYERLKKKYGGNLGMLQDAYQAAIKDQVGAYEASLASGEDNEVVDLGDLARYSFVDARGPFAANRTTENPHPGGYIYDVVNPTTGRVHQKPGRGYRFPEETMRRHQSEDRIIYPNDARRLVQLKKYLAELRPPLRGIIEIGSRGGAADLKRLVPKEAARFPNPKPTSLMELLIGFAGDSTALVLDPFAGSGTTAHAVMRLNAQDGGTRRFIVIEEGERNDRYCRTLIAPRLRAAIKQEDMKTGFSFLETGRRLNREAILELEREAITSLIVQTDITGVGGNITRVDGDHVIAHNGRREAICLRWNGRSDSTITRDVLVQMFEEVKGLRLNKPVRVYGSTCVVGETDSFRFCQIPDEIVAALSLSDEAEGADADAVVTAVEVLETASQGNLPAHGRH